MVAIKMTTIASSAATFPRVLDAWSVPSPMTTSEWAAKHRVLSASESAEAGPWQNDRTPYLCAPMDAAGSGEWDDVIIMKSAQVGMSEACRNIVGRWIDQDPGPVLLVMPDENSAKEVLDERYVPLINSTACLRDRIPNVRGKFFTARRVKLANMFIHIGYAGSPQSLASRPCRYVLFDEADKFPIAVRSEADPISLGKVRTVTFGQRSVRVYLSTPTDTAGVIYVLYNECPLKLRFHVPCPHCGAYQALAWDRVRWKKKKSEDTKTAAARIEAEQTAWYECEHCKEKILARHKPEIMTRGVWATDAHEISLHKTQRAADRANKTAGFEYPFSLPPRVSITGEWPSTRRIAFHITALLSPWKSFSDLAAEFIKSKKDVLKLRNFKNSFLGEPFEVQKTRIAASEFDEKIAAGHEEGVVPKWASLIIATADTQKDYFRYALRAWGHGYRSRLLEYGRAETFKDLYKKVFGFEFPVEEEGPMMSAAILGIDAGGTSVDDDTSRTDQVYRFAQEDSERIIPLHGMPWNRPMQGLKAQLVNRTYRPPVGDEYDVSFMKIDVNHYKSVLARRIKAALDSEEAWELHKNVGEDYKRQMASEHQVMRRKGSRDYLVWEVISVGAANHDWDDEVYQTAFADYLQVATLPTVAELEVARVEVERRRRNVNSELTTPDGRAFHVNDR